MDFLDSTAEDKLQKYMEYNTDTSIGGVEYIANSQPDENTLDFASMVPPHVTTFNSLFRPMYNNTKKLETNTITQPSLEEVVKPKESENRTLKRSEHYLNLKGKAKEITAEIDALKIPNDDKYFLKVLAERESSFNPNASITSKGKQYRGLYQFGDGALSGIGMSAKEYDTSTKSQHLAALKFGEQNIKGLEGYIGQKVKGVTITKAGMMAAAHLGGRGGLQALLEGKERKDKLGTSTLDYLRMFEH